MLLTDDQSWLDLKLDQTATVKGALTYAGPNGLTIQFADWSSLMIDADDATPLTDLVDEETELEVVRTEDGLFATADAITDALVQFGSL